MRSRLLEHPRTRNEQYYWPSRFNCKQEVRSIFFLSYCYYFLRLGTHIESPFLGSGKIGFLSDSWVLLFWFRSLLKKEVATVLQFEIKIKLRLTNVTCKRMQAIRDIQNWICLINPNVIFNHFIRSRVRMAPKMDRWMYEMINFEGARKFGHSRHTIWSASRCRCTFYLLKHRKAKFVIFCHNIVLSCATKGHFTI